jgi:hypothetical protein
MPTDDYGYLILPEENIVPNEICYVRFAGAHFNVLYHNTFQEGETQKRYFAGVENLDDIRQDLQLSRRN